MSTPRVYADFQNLDDANRLLLTCAGTLQDLQRQEIQLQEGLVLTFYSDDADDQGQPDELRVEGVVHYDADGQCWVATVDWALRHASEERAQIQPLDLTSGLEKGKVLPKTASDSVWQSTTTLRRRAMTPVAVRAQLTDALRLDLVGPGEVLGAEGQALGDASEILPQRPSTWYLTGFLVPLDADPEQKIDAQSADELDEGSDVQGLEDAVAPEPAAARVRYLPSSMGASLLVPADAKVLKNPRALGRLYRPHG